MITTDFLSRIRREIKDLDVDEDGVLVLKDNGKTIKVYFNALEHGDKLLEEIKKSDKSTFYILHDHEIEIGYHLLYLISSLLISKGKLRKVGVIGSECYIKYWSDILEEAKVYYTTLEK